ncbi:MAG: hypothetical protein WCS47_01880 [Thermovirgaceae bacterium]|nr:hypothetical protein [Synergistales bacterium]MDI9393395.1 hypothetical protein [Synergistota bacterium]HOI81436.1 hypothetical protein [Synergistales bacterium]HPJ48677.1 hypothetical protein [Synergistales bacterium]
MASLYRFFGFALLAIMTLIVWAYIDHCRNRKKATRYVTEKLQMPGVNFEMTRFVNMARIIRSASESLLLVFFLKDRHIEIPGFRPEEVVDIPPDGVLLADRERSRSLVYVERGKKIFFLDMKDFVPGTICYVKRGTGGVKFGEKEIPSSNRDWFLIDRTRGRTLYPPLRELEQHPGDGFFHLQGIAPTEGFLLDEEGGLLLVDEQRGTFAFRKSGRDLLEVFSSGDIISVETNDEDPDLLDFEVGRKRKTVFTFEFNDAGEAAYWKAWFEETKKGKTGSGEDTRSVFLKLPLLKGI